MFGLAVHPAAIFVCVVLAKEKVSLEKVYERARHPFRETGQTTIRFHFRVASSFLVAGHLLVVVKLACALDRRPVNLQISEFTHNYKC